VIDAVLDSIGQATVVVLELSGQNPNCFFEAGVAFARGVPTIRFIDDKEEIPFDVRGWGFIKYRDLDDLRKKLERQADRFARDEVTVERLE
jgi:nucleoside 2-deoxyribosyltransferase